MASAAGIKGADKVADNLAIMPSLSDMFNTSSSASSGLSTRDWGSHSVSINTGLDVAKFMMWLSVGVFAFFVVKKIVKGGK